MRALIFGAASIALSTSALAAANVPKKPVANHAVAIKSAPDMGAVFAIFDKLFPPQPDPDPARWALARTSAASMWPNGAYGNMMTGMMGNMFDRVMQLKQSDLPGAAKANKAGSPELSLHDQAAAKDPYFDQRTAAIKQVVIEETDKISAIIDPRVRDGLARSMARRFDARQLADINNFFATPSGHALATQYMQMWVDPDMMRALFGTMPEMMKLMPGMMQKVKAASEKFPSPPKPAKPAPKQGKP
jgi:electron transfer flavoprotein alpha subunit